MTLKRGRKPQNMAADLNRSAKSSSERSRGIIKGKKASRLSWADMVDEEKGLPRDDLLLFVRGDIGSVSLLLEKFEEFSNSTGLEANAKKCSVYFGGVSHDEEQQILEVSGFSKGNLPFKYLGVPLHSKKLTIENCHPLIARITAQIKHWTAKLLSYAGRLQLVKSVISGIAAYWLQVFPLPKAIIKHIQAICKSFLWSGSEVISKKAPISWKTICASKNGGGLKIMDPNTWNLAMIGKLVWNLSSKKDTLWVKWIHSYYMKNRPLHLLPYSQSWSCVLKAIFRCSTNCVALNI